MPVAAALAGAALLIPQEAKASFSQEPDGDYVYSNDFNQVPIVLVKPETELQAVFSSSYHRASISESGVSGTIRKTGPEDLYLLSSDNTYSGGTIVSQGFLGWDRDRAFGIAGTGVTIDNGAGVHWIGSFATTRAFTLTGGIATMRAQSGLTGTVNGTISGPGALTVGGVGLVAPGTIVLGGNNTYQGGTSIIGGTLQISSDSNLGEAGTNVTVNNALLEANGTFSTNRVIALNDANSRIGVTSAGQVFTLSGLVGGVGTLTKTGAGTLVLANSNNSYLGGTSVNAGTLQVSSDANLGAASGGVTLNGGTLGTTASFVTNRTFNLLSGAGGIAPATGTTLTLNGPVTGSGTLNHIGAGTLVLAGTNTYAGGTLINGGTLEVRDGSSLGTGNVLNDGTLLINNANAMTLANIIGSTGVLTKTGAGTLTLTGVNNYSGQTNVSNGTLIVTNNNALGTSASGTTVATGATLAVQGGLTALNEGIAVRGTGVGGAGALRNLSGDNVLTAGVILTGATLITSDAGLLDLAGPLQSSGTFGLTFGGAGSVSLRGQIVGSISGLTKTGSGTLILGSGFNPSGYNAGLDLAQGTVSVRTNLGAGFGTIRTTGSVIDYAQGVNMAAPIELNSNTTQLQVTTGTATQSGIISEINGARPIEKIGNGSLILSGQNSYSGGTVISAGTLRIGADANLGAASGGITINNNANLTFTSDLTTNRAITLSGTANIDTNSNVTLGGVIGGTGTLTKFLGGTLILTNTNTYAGGTTINGGAVQIGNGGTTGTLGSGTVTINGAELIFNRSDDITVANDITSSGTLIKRGGGTVTLTGAKGYSNTFVEAGTLALRGTSPLSGGGVLQLTGGTLDMGVDGVLSSATHSGGTLALNGRALILTTGNYNASGGSITGGGTIQFAGNSRGLLINGATSIDAGTTILSSGFNNRVEIGSLGADYTLAAAITGSGTAGNAGSMSVTINNAGFRTTLSGNSSYAAGTTVQSGTLVVGSDTALGTGPVFLVLNAGLESGGAGNRSINNDILLLSSGMSIGNPNAGTSFTLGGRLLGGGGGEAFTKTGAGTLILTGNNTLSGNIALNAGTLQLGSGALGGSLGSSGVVMANGTSLVFDSSASQNVSNVLSGTGSLTKRGSGTLTLSGNNSFSGAVSLDGGALQLTGGSSIGDTAALSMATGTLLGVGSSETIGSLAGNGTVVLQASSDLTTGGNNNSTTFGGSLTGIGGLTKTGSGTFTLTGTSNFLGTTTISGGTLQIGNNTTTGTIIGGSIVNNASLVFNRSDNIDTLVAISGTGSLTKLGAGTLTLLNTNSYAGGTIISAGILQLGSGSNAASLGTGGVTISSGTTLRSNSSATQTIAGALSGSGSLVQQGTGTTILGAAAIGYSGTAQIFAGTLQLGNLTALGTGAVELRGGSLHLANAGTYTNNINSFTADGNVLSTVAGSQVTLTGQIGGAGTLRLAPGTGSTLDIAAATGTAGATTRIIVQSGTVRSQTGVLGQILALADTQTQVDAGATLNFNTRLSTISNLSGAGTILNDGSTTTLRNGTFSGAFGGTQSLATTGNISLSGSSSYTGTTTVRSGTLTIGSSGALGSSAGGTTVDSGATLQFSGTPLLITDALTISGTGDGGIGAIRVVPAGVSGNESTNLTGGITLAADSTITVTDRIALSVNTGGISLGSSTLTFASEGTGNSAIFVNSAISGTGGLIKTGPNVLNLSGTNTFTGPLTINGGSVVLINGAALADTVAVTVGSNTILDVLASETIGSLTGSGRVILRDTSTLTVGGNSTSTTYSGTGLNGIVGTGNLAKTGTGTLVLSGDNGYSGTTTISGGTLQIGNGGTTGTLGSGNVINNAALTFDRANSFTVANAISGIGGLTKLGAGTLTLSGANSYAGSTTVQSGTLTITNAQALGTGAGGTTVVSGATLHLSGALDNQTEAVTINGFGVNNTGALYSSGGSNGFSLTPVTLGSASRINSDNELSLTSVIGGGNALTLGGTGRLFINGNLSGVTTLITDGTGLKFVRAGGPSGATTVNAGVLVVDNTGSLSDTALVTVNGSGTLRYGVADTIGALAGTGTVELLGGALTTGGNNASTSFTGVFGGTGELIKVGTGTFTLGGQSFRNGVTTISGGTLVLQGGQALSDSNYVFVDTFGTLRVEAGETIGGIGGPGSIVLATSAPLVVNAQQNLTFGGVISQSGVGVIGSFTNRGPATQTITAAQTFTGQTSVEAGQLALTGSGALASTSISTSTGARLTTDGGALAANAIISHAGILTLSGSETIGSISGTGAISLFNATLSTGNASDATLSGIISGTNGALIKTGTGTLTLSGANTYNGGTTISAGTLVLNQVAGGTIGAAGTSQITIASGGNLLSNVTGTLANRFFLSSSTAASIAAASGTTLTLTGDQFVTAPPFTLTFGSSSATGTIDLAMPSGVTIGSGMRAAIAGGTVRTSTSFGASILGLASGGTTIGTGATSATLDVNGISFNLVNLGGNASGTLTNLGSQAATTTINSVAASTFAGTITNGASALNLTKFGNATLTLTGSNSYTGITDIQRGTLQIGDGGTTGSLGTGAVTLNALGSLAFNRSNALTIANAISGSGALRQIGSGTTTLTGDSSGFSGTTVVSAGSLQVNGSLGGAISVTGGTLGGTGRLGAATIGNGGRLAPGQSPGTMTFASLTLDAGSLTTFELGEPDIAGGPNNDLIVVDGTLTLNGGTIDIVQNTGFVNGRYTLFQFGSLSGFASNLTLNPLSGGFVGTLARNADTIILNAAPPEDLIYWNGSTTAPTGAVVGGSGTWNFTSRNFTEDDGDYSGVWAGNGFNAVFAGTGGTVTIAADTTVAPIGLAFLVDGYTITGGNAASRLELTGPTGIDTASGAGATIDASMSGAGSLTKTGAGTLTLSGANTYQGETTIMGGTLVAGSNTALGSGAAGVTVTNGATLSVANSITINKALTINGNGVGGTGALQVGSAARYDGTITLGSDSRVFGNLGFVDDITTDYALALAGRLTVEGAITGTGSVTVASLGDVILRADNSYAGTTTISANSTLTLTDGVLAGTGGTLGAGLVTNNGTLQVQRSGDIMIANAISGSGMLFQAGTGTTTLTGANTYAGKTTVVSGTLALASGGSLAGDVTNNATFTNAGTVNGLVSNTRSLTSTGTLAGGLDNTATGTANLAGTVNGKLINAGTITLTGTLTGTAALDQEAGASFDIDGQLASLGSISGSGEIILGGGGLTIGGDNADTTFAGIISGTGTVTKNGTGTQTLTGQNSYAGTTTISGGTLALTGSGSLASSSISITSGGTLSTDGGALAPTSVIVNDGQFAISGNETVAEIGGMGSLSLDGTLTTGGRNTSTTLAGAVTGSGGLTKVGTGTFTLTGDVALDGAVAVNGGTLALSGDNSFGQGITVGGGTLQLGSNNAAGGSAGRITTTGSVISYLDGVNSATPITLASNTTQLMVASGSATQSGVIGETGGARPLEKTGAGTLVLGGLNTFTGPFTVTEGTLTLGTQQSGSSIFGLVIGSANTVASATVQLNGSYSISSLASGPSPAGTSASLVMGNGANLLVSGASTSTYGGSISGGGTFRVIGDAELTLTGDATAYQGNLAAELGGSISVTGNGQVGARIAGAAFGSTFSTDGGALSRNTNLFAFGEVTFTGSEAVSYINQANFGRINLSGANTVLTLTGESAAGLSVSIQSQGVISGEGGLTVDGGVFIASVGSRLHALSGVNTYTGATTINKDTLLIWSNGSIASSVVTIGAEGVLETDGNSFTGSPAVTNNGSFLVNGSETIGSLAGSGSVTIAAGTGLLTGTNNTSTTFSGTIGGDGAFTKTGTGMMTITGTVDLAGSLTVNGGTLALSGNNTIGGGITVGGGTLRLNGNNAAGGAAGRITTTGSVIDYADGITMATPITLASDTTQLQVTTGSATQSGVIGETGGARPLAKTGAGTLVLTGSNTYTGGTTISGGTLQVSSGANLGGNARNTVTLDGGTLRATNGIAINGIVTAAGGTINIGAGQFNVQSYDTQFGGLLTKTSDGPSTLYLFGTGTGAGGIRLENGTLGLRNGRAMGTGQLSMAEGTRLFLDAGSIVMPNVIVLGAGTGSTIFTAGVGSSEISGIISGGSLTVGNTGVPATLILSGANTYGGSTRVTNATLAITGNGSIVSTDIAVDAGATLLTDGGALSNLAAISNAGTFRITGAESIGSIAGSGSVVLDAALTTGGNNGSTTVSGVIGGGGGLTKIGSGTLTLTGVNTYTGTTSVQGGTLALTGAGSLAGNSIVVGTGGTLVTDGGALSNIAQLDVDGAFTMGGDETIEAISGTGGLTLNGVLTVLGANELASDVSTLTGKIGGTGSLIKNGAGTLNVAGDIDLDGTLRVNTGTLLLSGTNAAGPVVVDGTLRLQNGGTLAGTTGTIATVAGTSGGATVTGAGSAWTSTGDLEVGNGGSGTLTISAGGTVSNAFARVGDAAGSIGAVTVTGADSLWANAVNIELGTLGTGTLTVSNGGDVTSNAGFVAYGAGSTGTATVTGAGSSWTNTNQLYVGYEGVGGLTISGGGGVANSIGYLGRTATGQGTVTVTGTGSTWATPSLVVGYAGTGNLAIADGGQVTSSSLAAGLEAGSSGTISVTGAGRLSGPTGTYLVGEGGTGTLTISNGGTVVSQRASLGNLATGNGSVVISGTGSSWNSSQLLYIGNRGTGTLTLTNGGTLVTAALTLGTTTGGFGTLNIGAAAGQSAAAAGTVVTPSITFGAGSGLLVFNHTNSNLGLASSMAGNGSIDHLEGYTSLTGNLALNGSIDVLGGTLVLSGDNSIAGGIAVANATLRLASNTAAGGTTGRITTTGSVIDYANGVTIGTPITLASNSTQLQVTTGSATQSGAIGEAGSARPLEKIGGGTLVLGGSNTFTGPLTITEGTLRTGSTQALNSNVAVVVGGAGTTTGATFDVVSGVFVKSLASGGNASLATVSIANDGYLGITGGSSTTYSGRLTGPGLLSTSGSGSLTLDGAGDTFTGTIVAGGTSRIALLGNSTFDLIGLVAEAGATITTDGGALLRNDIEIEADGTLRFTGSETTGGLRGAGTGVVDLVGSGTTLTLTGRNAGGPSTFAGSITGSGNLAMTGGDRTLTGVSTYTGTTTLSGGAGLALTGAGALASTSITLTGDSGLITDGGALASGAHVSLTDSLLFTTGEETFASIAQSGGLVSGTGPITVGSYSQTGGAATASVVTINTGTFNQSGNSLVARSTTVNVSGTATLAGGTIAGTLGGSGAVTVTGTTQVSGTVTGPTTNASLLMVDEGTFTGPLVNNATLVIESGTFSGGLTNTRDTLAKGSMFGNVVNAVGGQFLLSGNLTGGGGSFVNRGMLAVEGFSYTGLGAITNSGTIGVWAGRTLAGTSFSQSGGLTQVEGTLAAPTVTVSGGTFALLGGNVVGNVANAGTFTATGNAAITGNFANTGTATFAVLGGRQSVSGTWSDAANATVAFTFNTDTQAAGLLQIGGAVSGDTAVEIAAGGPVLRFSPTPKVLIETGGGSGSFTLAGTALPGNALVNYTFGQLAPTRWGLTSNFNYGGLAGVASAIQAARIGLATGFHQPVNQSLAESGQADHSMGLWLRAAFGRHDQSRTLVAGGRGTAMGSARTDSFGFEGGVDATLAAGNGWRLRAGVMGGRSEGDATAQSSYTGFAGSSTAAIETRVTFAGLYGVLTSGGLTLDLDYRREWHDLAISAAATVPGSTLGLLSAQETAGRSDVVQVQAAYQIRSGRAFAKPVAGIIWQQGSIDALAFSVANVGAATLAFADNELLLGHAGLELGYDFDLSSVTRMTPFLGTRVWGALGEDADTLATVGGQTSALDPQELGSFGETRVGLRFAPQSGRGFGAELSGSVRYGSGTSGYSLNAGIRYGF